MSFSDQAGIDLGITPQPRRPHLGPHPHLYLYKGGMDLHFVKTRNLWSDPKYRDREVGRFKQILFDARVPKGTLVELYPWKIRGGAK